MSPKATGIVTQLTTASPAFFQGKYFDMEERYFLGY